MAETNSGLPLPDECAHKVLTFLPAKHILRTAATSRAFRSIACSPEVWLDACKRKWPDVALSQALARAARTRGPMQFYRRRASCDGALCPHTEPPLCALDDLLFTVVMDQNGTQLCSVACEASTAMRRNLRANNSDGDDDHWNADGLCLDGLGARVICPGDVFPPHAHDEDLTGEYDVFITINVVRKSDGMVSPFMPRCAMRFNGGLPFNNELYPTNEPRRWFEENPLLQGFLPWESEVPRDPDGVGVLNEGTQLNAPLPDCTITPMLSTLSEQLGDNVQFSVKRPTITCKFHIGSLAEFPRHTLQPGSWTPAPDPAIIVRSDCVEVRRIHLSFSLWHGDLGLDAPENENVWFDRKIDLDGLHRLLSERLRFA